MKEVLSPARVSAIEWKAHSRGVIIIGPLFIFIIFVVTPKGRIEITSILSLFYN